METRPQTLPVHRIEGTFFDVDFNKRQFVKTGAPSHLFSFDEMVYKGSHYEMDYDKYHEMPARPGVSDAQDVVRVKIPQLKELALAEMAEAYQIPAYELKNKSDFEVMVNMTALAEREKGILPMYEIFDQKFTVDLDNYCFRKGNLSIPLKGFKPLAGPNGDRYAYIDSTTYQVVKLDFATLKEMPSDQVVKVIIPSDDRLDPYYIGKTRATDLKTFLLTHPMEARQKANIIPLGQTSIPHIVELNVNREKLKKQQELREQFEQTQKRNKRKLYKGIR